MKCAKLANKIYTVIYNYNGYFTMKVINCYIIIKISYHMSQKRIKEHKANYHNEMLSPQTSSISDHNADLTQSLHLFSASNLSLSLPCYPTNTH